MEDLETRLAAYTDSVAGVLAAGIVQWTAAAAAPTGWLAAGFWIAVLKATLDRRVSAIEGAAAASMTASPVANEMMRMPDLPRLMSPEPTSTG